MPAPNTITAYHAHVYFDANTVEQARALCQQAAGLFGVTMGRVHEKTVGPHPMWSCQLAASPAQFVDLLPWLTLNRGGLIVFAHPETGNGLADHRDHGIWLGTGLELKLSIFN
ncbi:MAG: aromatic ring-cleaving dioxygenase [Granulosicoccus sp.]|jgi:aromatic ring-cleaving dioxygenase